MKLLLKSLKSILVFPKLSRSGFVGQFAEPIKEQHAQVSKSIQITDEIINPSKIITKLVGITKRQQLMDILLDKNFNILNDFKDE